MKRLARIFLTVSACDRPQEPDYLVPIPDSYGVYGTYEYLELVGHPDCARAQYGSQLVGACPE
jgi:hypothetical protein